MIKTPGFSKPSAKDFLIAISIFLECTLNEDPVKYDIVVYGGTSSGVILAVAMAGNGAKLLLIEQAKPLGGRVISGLNTAESNRMINKFHYGYCLEIYIRMGNKFSSDFLVHMSS